MKLIPSIDLIAGKSVRLLKGNYDNVIEYIEKPIDVAKRYEAAGVKFLHIVDLDAADLTSNNKNIIADICKQTSLSIQVGGGIRTADQVLNLLDLGVNKVVIGSLAVTNEELIKKLANEYSHEKIVLAFDVKKTAGQPLVYTSAWKENSNKTLWQMLEVYSEFSQILCTDINCDGTLESPSFALYQEILEKYPALKLQASGGVSKLNDLVKLKKNKLPFCIVGRALYENKFSIEEALACLQNE